MDGDIIQDQTGVKAGSMVLILDGHTEIGAHIRRNLCLIRGETQIGSCSLSEMAYFPSNLRNMF